MIGTVLSTQARTTAQSAPINIVAPTISRLGDVLYGTPGQWAGFPVPVLMFQWERDGEPIGGATAQDYTVQGEDLGANITFVVTATNAVDTETETAGPFIPEQNESLQFWLSFDLEGNAATFIFSIPADL